MKKYMALLLMLTMTIAMGMNKGKQKRIPNVEPPGMELSDQNSFLKGWNTLPANLKIYILRQANLFSNQLENRPVNTRPLQLEHKPIDFLFKSFSRDGAFFAVTKTRPNILYIYDLSGKCIRKFEFEDPLFGHFCVSRGLTKLAIYCEESLRVFDTCTGRCIRKLNFEGRIDNACFDNNSQIVLCCGKNIIVYDYYSNTRKKIIPLKEAFTTYTPLIISPDGTHLALNIERLQSVEIYNLVTGQRVKRFDHSRYLYPKKCMCFNHDNTQLGVIQDKKVFIIDLKTGKDLAMKEINRGIISSVNFNDDGSKVAFGTEYCSFLWDLSSNKCKLINQNQSNSVFPFTGAEFSPDGSMLAINCDGRNVHLIDVERKSLQQQKEDLEQTCRDIFDSTQPLTDKNQNLVELYRRRLRLKRSPQIDKKIRHRMQNDLIVVLGGLRRTQEGQPYNPKSTERIILTHLLSKINIQNKRHYLKYIKPEIEFADSSQGCVIQ